MTTVQESRNRRLQTNRDTPKGAQNPGMNETELSSPFNRKPHVTDQDFIEFNIFSLIIFNYLTENASCFADRQNIYADRYRSADQRLRTTDINHIIQHQNSQIINNIFAGKKQNAKKLKSVQNVLDNSDPA